MAFDINSFVSKNTKTSGGFDVNSFVDSYTKSAKGNFDVDSFLLKQGIVKQDSLKTSEGLTQYALSKGVKVPEKKESASALMRAMGILNVGTAATAGLFKGAIDKDQSALGGSIDAIKKSLSGEDLLGYSDVARAGGINPKSRVGKIALGTGGFIADVLLDPLTYLTFGIAPTVKVAGQALTKGGSKLLNKTSQELVEKTLQEESLRLGRELTEKEAITISNKTARRAEIMFEQAIGKKGITKEATERLVSEGFDREVIQNVATRAPQLLDKGGIKFFGRSLIEGKTIGDSVIGKSAKQLGELEIVKTITTPLRKLFDYDFAKNPAIQEIIEKGSIQTRKAIDGIIKANSKLFKGLNDDQMTEFFDTVFKKKLEIAEADKGAKAAAKKLSKEEAAELGVRKVGESGKVPTATREAMENRLRQEAKAAQKTERLIFEDLKLQRVADELFEPKIVQTVGKNGAVKIQTTPSIMSRFAKLAGLSEEDAIKFYIPSKFRDRVKVKDFAMGGGIGAPKMDFLKKFRGVENENLIRDPFEAITRGQIDVVSARIKTDTIKTVMEKIGISPEDFAKLSKKDQAKFVKIDRNILATQREAAAKKLAIEKLIDTNEVQAKIQKLLSRYNKSFRSMSTELFNLNKAGLKASLRKTYRDSPEKLKSAIKTTIKPSEFVDKRPTKWDDFSNSYAVKDKLVKEFGSVNLLALDVKMGGASRLVELGFDESTAMSIARQIFKEPVLKPKTIKLDDKLVNMSRYKPKKFIESLIAEDAKGLKSIQNKIADRESKLSKLIDEISFLKYGLESTKYAKDIIKQSGDLNLGKAVAYVPKEIKEQMGNLVEAKSNTLNELFRATGFDWATGLFKSYVTSLFPAFHFRNMVSNQFQNALKLGVDVLNPMIQKRASDIALGRNLDTVLVKKNGERITLGQIRKMVDDQSDILDSGAFGRTEQLIDEAKTKIVREGTGKANPFSRENIAFKGGRAVGSYAENQAKMVNILTNVMEGKSVKDGIKSAEEALFNYSKLTSFEKDVMRRLIPFYTFSKKNMELYLKTLATTPGAVAAQFDFIKGLGESFGDPITPEDYEGLPDYMKKGVGIKGSGVNKFGQSTFFTGFGLPVEEFLGRFSGDKGIVSNVISDTITRANPIGKFLVERATNKDFFRDRPITELDNAQDLKVFLDVVEKGSPELGKQLKEMIQWAEIKGQPIYENGKIVGSKDKYTANPFVLHFMRNLFTSRIQSTIGFLSSEEETGFNKLLRSFTGVRGWSIDQEEQKFFNEMERFDEVKDFLIRQGLIKKFESVYVPKK